MRVKERQRRSKSSPSQSELKQLQKNERLRCMAPHVPHILLLLASASISFGQHRPVSRQKSSRPMNAPW